MPENFRRPDMSTPPRSPVITTYAIAVLSVAAAVAIDLAFHRFSGTDPSVSLFLCAVMFAAWAGGTGPALFATALAILAFDYFFLEPVYSFALAIKEIPRLVFFAAAALFVVSLSAAQRRAAVALHGVSDEQQAMVRQLRELNDTLRQSEAELAKTRHELQLIIDTVPVLMLRHRADGVIDFVNQVGRSYSGIVSTNWTKRTSAITHPDDVARLEEAWDVALATGEPFETEARLRRADGEYRWFATRRVPLRDRDGEVTAWYAATYDIEDRKRAEDAQRRSEAALLEARHELQLIIDTIPALVVRHRADGIIDFVNQTWRRYTGLSQAAWKGRGSVVVHPDDLARVEQIWLAHLKTGEAFESEQRLRNADGEYRWHFLRRVPLRNDNGDVIAWYGAAHDIEDRRRAEDAWRASETQLAEARRELELTIDSIPAFVATYELDGRRSFVNQAWQNYTGRTLQEATGGGGHTALFHPDDAERALDAWRASLASGEPLRVDVRVRTANGEYRWNTHRRVPRRGENGNIVKWYSVGVDIEDQKNAENALRASETRLARAEQELRLTLDTIPTLAWRILPDGFAEYLNKRWLDYTGFTLEQALGWKWQAAIHPDDRARLLEAWQEMLASEKPAEIEARMRRFDGEYRWFLFRAEPSHNEAGDVVGWYGTNTDIEDRKRFESALQRSQAYSAEAQRLSQTGSFAWDIATRDYFWSDQTYQILGFDRSVKPSISLVVQRTHPEDRLMMERELDRSAQRAPSHDFEVRLLMPDGQIKHIHLLAHRITYQSGNEEIVGAVMDTTEARKSQETLQAAQSALAHASRVATLGEISASIAHEVNQPLAAIVANGQACLRFLKRETPNLEDVRGAVEWIVKDGNRAGEVIRRVRGLLKKADTEKVPLDVNDLIEEVAALLQHELAVQQVSLRMELAPAISPIFADRVQLQQVIINLVMNGAEAMQAIADTPHGLTIRSYEDEARRVVVAVQDSGVGIPGGNAERVFEAFFSTKPGGLGMGLSICRSIVEAHGGQLWSSANAGPGATFQFALPSRRETAA
jgi:PAS domain S-box-containing protein